MGNLFDQVELDIEKLHQELNSGILPFSRNEHYLNILHRVLCRFNYYDAFIESGFIRGWFQEFHEFWSCVAHGRTLNLPGFFYLYSHYRIRFQYVEVEEQAKASAYKHAWQRYENIFTLFQYVYKDAAHPFAYRSFKKVLPEGGRILEYGCGAAPIVTSMVKSRCKRYQYTIADIRGFPYLYAKYRLMQHGVECVDIEPYQAPKLTGRFDAIFLQTVLEHLPDPVVVMNILTDHLNSGGILVFDYILSEGRGLDTKEAVQMRGPVLDHIKANYQLLRGQLLYDKSMSTTVARKN
jgi:2-polyprenyl-3-methyl-5-hydroxy-6-metoxy-1,4-benzoquinol methylase